MGGIVTDDRFRFHRVRARVVGRAEIVFVPRAVEAGVVLAGHGLVVVAGQFDDGAHRAGHAGVLDVRVPRVRDRVVDLDLGLVGFDASAAAGRGGHEVFGVGRGLGVGRGDLSDLSEPGVEDDGGFGGSRGEVGRGAVPDDLGQARVAGLVVGQDGGAVRRVERERQLGLVSGAWSVLAGWFGRHVPCRVVVDGVGGVRVDAYGRGGRDGRAAGLHVGQGRFGGVGDGVAGTAVDVALVAGLVGDLGRVSHAVGRLAGRDDGHVVAVGPVAPCRVFAAHVVVGADVAGAFLGLAGHEHVVSDLDGALGQCGGVLRGDDDLDGACLRPVRAGRLSLMPYGLPVRVGGHVRVGYGGFGPVGSDPVGGDGFEAVHAAGGGEVARVLLLGVVPAVPERHGAAGTVVFLPVRVDAVVGRGAGAVLGLAAGEDGVHEAAVRDLVGVVLGPRVVGDGLPASGLVEREAFVVEDGVPVGVGAFEGLVEDVDSAVRGRRGPPFDQRAAGVVVGVRVAFDAAGPSVGGALVPVVSGAGLVAVAHVLQSVLPFGHEAGFVDVESYVVGFDLAVVDAVGCVLRVRVASLDGGAGPVESLAAGRVLDADASVGRFDGLAGELERGSGREGAHVERAGPWAAGAGAVGRIVLVVQWHDLEVEVSGQALAVLP